MPISVFYVVSFFKCKLRKGIQRKRYRAREKGTIRALNFSTNKTKKRDLSVPKKNPKRRSAWRFKLIYA